MKSFLVVLFLFSALGCKKSPVEPVAPDPVEAVNITWTPPSNASWSGNADLSIGTGGFSFITTYRNSPSGGYTVTLNGPYPIFDGATKLTASFAAECIGANSGSIVFLEYESSENTWTPIKSTTVVPPSSVVVEMPRQSFEKKQFKIRFRFTIFRTPSEYELKTHRTTLSGLTIFATNQ